jgi:hypothetical protein
MAQQRHVRMLVAKADHVTDRVGDAADAMRGDVRRKRSRERSEGLAPDEHPAEGDVRVLVPVQIGEADYRRRRGQRRDPLGRRNGQSNTVLRRQ